MLKKIIFFLTFYLGKLHDKKIAERLISLDFKPQIVFDVGAHIGEATLFFLKIFNSIKVCYCFEPQKNIFNILKKKFNNNSKVFCVNKAIYDKIVEKDFNIMLNHQRSSTLEEINSNSLYYKIKSFILFNKVKTIIYKKQKLNCITLDSFIKKRKVIDILKIDVEGSELKVLKGCKKNIKNVKVILIEILHHDSIINYSKIDIFKFLKKNGFQLYSTIKFPFYHYEDRIYINNNFFQNKINSFKSI
jgi:FkbM family methyltransferase